MDTEKIVWRNFEYKIQIQKDWNSANTNSYKWDFGDFEYKIQIQKDWNSIPNQPPFKT